MSLNFPVFKDGGEVTELLWDKGNTVDKIIVLQNGYIEEMGTHEELMEKKGYYYELVKLQTGVDEL